VFRRVAAIVAVVACATGVVAYQATRPAKAPASPRVFVPSPKFFTDFSPSFRTSIADAYYLYMVQYYGEHLNSDQRFDALPGMLDVITTLSPHFKRAYFFGAFALIDAGKPSVAYDLLKRGFAANPGDWHFPSYLGFFAYGFASNKDKARIAAAWYQKAAAIPGRPGYIPRLAADLLTNGGEVKKAVLMWGSVYADGDKYSQQKAVAGLEKVLPAGKAARMKAVAPLYGTMPKAEFDALIAELFKGYK
jgi:hypothetical protein